jgi:NTP pyrophosphatase (non-canonical NTP hydrolase)
MDTRTEILTILQEEAAEVIQIISKIHRFGFNTDAYSTDGVFTTNARRLEQELGDLQCMIDLCIDQTMLQIRTKEKREKLKTWSNIPV